jgi:chromatin structure-remodeling complex subunit RSC1/2
VIFLAKLFDRDPTTNEVLWFAAPPTNMSRARGLRYSLEYLTFIATKRKQREAGRDREEGTKNDWEGGGSASAKRPKVVAPTVTETMREVWKEMNTDGYVV